MHQWVQPHIRNIRAHVFSKSNCGAHPEIGIIVSFRFQWAGLPPNMWKVACFLGVMATTQQESDLASVQSDLESGAESAAEGLGLDRSFLLIAGATWDVILWVLCTAPRSPRLPRLGKPSRPDISIPAAVPKVPVVPSVLKQ